jgi:hypothetical protein
VLFPKPQLLASLAEPSIQVPESDSAGSAQFVKSALICVAAFELGLEQRALFATMIASLSACDA